MAFTLNEYKKLTYNQIISELILILGSIHMWNHRRKVDALGLQGSLPGSFERCLQEHKLPYLDGLE